MNLRDIFTRFFKHVLHIPFENKGILIPVYWLVSFLGIAFIFDLLYEKNIRLHVSHKMLFLFFLSLLVTGIWTLLTSNDYYKNEHGEKIKVEIENSFFWVKMKYWIYVFIALAIIVACKAQFFQ